MNTSQIINNNKEILCADLTNKSEPNFKKARCAYCGDAPVSHALFYVLNLISDTLDGHIKKVANYAPEFLESFADWFPTFVFRVFEFFKMARFSGDIERAKTFRSRVIWEEANRRGIKMEQLILWGKPLDHYRAYLNISRKQRVIYFDSIPIPPQFSKMKAHWDDKFILKQAFIKEGIPVPDFATFSTLKLKNIENIFSNMKGPVIVKPKLGSRGRHTTTNIRTLMEFKEAVALAGQISPSLIAEEHLEGDVCRATLVAGVLAGFYRGHAPEVVGDGVKTVKELIEEKNKNRNARVESVVLNEELKNYIKRSGFGPEDILPTGATLLLSHRVGRLFGGRTKEMLGDLHPSFIPILEHATAVTELPVVGFDCIVPDPTKPAESQRWGIIECNTLPFIDLHYYALEGKPKNIAGMVWDLWN